VYSLQWGIGISQAAFRSLLLLASCLSVLFLEVGSRLCRAGIQTTATTPGSRSAFSLRSYLRQLSVQRNFWAFVGMNAVMEMQGTFHSQFNAIVADILMPSFSGAVLPLLGLAGFVAAYAATLVADSYGTYFVIRYAIFGKVLVCVSAAILVAHTIVPPDAVACIVMVLLQVGMSSATKFFDVTVANLADEFSVLTSAEVDVTSRMYATHAVFAKPLNSLAPIIATRVLSTESYREMKVAGGEPPWELQRQALRLLIGLPLAVGLVQWASWRRFSLHGKGLSRIQALRRPPK